ncbi:MAG: hypothetical protein HYY62_02825 [Deltaproteobacteria bacterium]|nr:hypothetical protein [Deltaproteobacteria bacterium]
MKFPQLVVYAFMTALLCGQLPVFAQEKDPFHIAGQHWGKESPNSYPHVGRIWNEKDLIARQENTQILYRILAQAEEGVTILNAKTQEFHTLPVASQNISLSKNYIFMTSLKESGFFVLRLMDLYQFGFHSPIPLFFIPLDPELGTLEEIVPKHNENLQEETLLLKSTQKYSEIIQMDFNDVRDIMKAQLISLAVTQAVTGSQSSELALLVNDLKKELEQFYEDLHQDLERLRQTQHLIPKELEALNWEKSTVEELSQTLAKVEDYSELQELKLRYAQRFSILVEAFDEKYTALVHNVEFSFVAPMEGAPIQLASLESSLAQEITAAKEDETRYALQWIGGITVGAAFVTLVLHKLFKQPFSVLAEKYCYFHNKNTSWVGYLLKKLISSGTVSESPSVAKTLKTLLPAEEGLFKFKATGAYFKRSFAQLGGDTATVVATELLFRPLQPGWRSPADVMMEVVTGTERERLSSDHAILINEPFDEKHSLWLQKNFLERIVGNQILGTINTAVNLQFLEKEYNAILQYYVTESGVEHLVASQPRRRGGDLAFTRFNDKQKRELAYLIHGDLKEIQDELTTKIQKLNLASAPKTPPTLVSLDIEQNVARFKTKWTEHIETLSGSSSSPSAKAELEALLETKVRATYQATLNTMNLTPQRIGFVQKCLLAFNKAAIWSLSRVFGEKLATKTWGIWTSMNEPYLWNAIMMHSMTRGSFNATQYIYRRCTSLTFTTPFWIASYQALRNRGMIRTDRQEFLFGIGYGFVTNLVTHYIFVYGYEKYLVGTTFDLESSKLFSRHQDLPEDSTNVHKR